MCGRFAQSKMDDALVEEFGITGSVPDSPLPASWNITPTKEIYLVKANPRSPARDLAIASWGLIAPWQKDLSSARASQSRAINARSESVFEKPTFRDSFRKRRCLVPADGYYEWATAMGPYRPKQPFFISRTDRRSISLAGIWSRWISPAGDEIESVAIITRQAVGILAPIHSRMPVFIPNERWDSWLAPALTEISEIRALMEYPDPDAGLTVHAVTTLVNSVAHDGAQLIEPITLGEPETLF